MSSACLHLRRHVEIWFRASGVIKIGLASSLLFLNIGCSSLWKSEPTVVGQIGFAEGQWRGKALVKNTRDGKSATLDLDILAIEPDRLRMEIISSFGTHLASIAMNGGEVSYLLSQEKRFVVSRADENALVRLIPIRLSPNTLISVLFERNLSDREWNCKKTRSGLNESCRHRSEQILISWIERDKRRRRLRIATNEAKVEMILDEAKSKVEMGPEAFTITPPGGYKKELIAP